MVTTFKSGDVFVDRHYRACCRSNVPNLHTTVTGETSFFLFPFVEAFMIDNREKIEIDKPVNFLIQAVFLAAEHVSLDGFSQTVFHHVKDFFHSRSFRRPALSYPFSWYVKFAQLGITK